MQQFLVNAWSSNAILYHGPNSHKSSCASLLAVCAKSLKSNETHKMTPSLFLKFIVDESILEGAQFAPTNFQAFELIVASTFNADFQLIVELFLNPNWVGARVVPITSCSNSEGEWGCCANVNYAHIKKLVIVESMQTWQMITTSNNGSYLLFCSQ